MSIFGSLTTGISGLQAQSSALGHISDNIANSQTTGYKRVDTAFTNLVLQSNSRVHNPGGVVARPSYANSVSGNITTVDRATNLAVRGQGFFSVSRLSTENGVSVASAERFYTRDGSFELDDQRILTNRAGYALNGYIFNQATNSYTTTVSPIQVTADIDSPVATRNIELRANLPKNPTAGQPIQPTTISIFDATGTKHDITIGWRPGQTDGAWRMTIDAPGAVGSLPLSGTLPGFPVSAQSTSLTQGRNARQQIEEVQFATAAGGGIKIGDVYRVTLNGIEFSETVTTSNAGQLANIAGVAQSLADKINGAVPPVGVTAAVTNGRLRLTSTTAGDDFTLTTNVTNGTVTNNSANAPVTTPPTTTSPQQSVITFAGTNIDIGDVYTLNVDNNGSQTYTVTITAANIGQIKDLSGVVQALAARVNANSAAENVIASSSGNTLTLRGTVVGDTFNVGEQAGETTQINVVGPPAVAQVTELAYPANAATVGNVMSTTINGTTVNYTVAGTNLNTELTAFAAAINGSAAGASITASVSGNRIVITADTAGTGFTVSARDRLMQAGVTNATPADTTTFVSAVQGNLEGSRQTQRMSISGVPGDVGATYSVTLRSPTTTQVDPAARAGTTTTQNVVGPPAVAQVTNINYGTDAAVVGNVLSATVNGTVINYTVASTNLNTELTAFAAAINASAVAADLTAAVSGNAIVLTADTAGTPFNLTDTDDFALDPPSEVFDFSATSATAPTVGSRYAVTMNGSTYSLLITEQNITDYASQSDVLDNLVTQISNDFGAPFTASAVRDVNGNTTGLVLTGKEKTTVLNGTQETLASFNQTITYTTTGQEVSLDEIAANLALKVNQTAGVPVQASSIGGVITLTANQNNVAFFGEPVAVAGNTPPHIGLTFGGATRAGTLSSLSSANIGDGNATVSAVNEDGSPAQITFSVDYGDGPQTITLDLGTFGTGSALTEYEGSSINVISQLQDGSAQGTFRDVEIRENGDVVANYDNGNKRVIAKVPLVLFNDPNSLNRETGGVFTESSDSGRARFTDTGLNGAGTIAVSSLEGSNVDIAQEFTKLIVAQRSYTANTRVITTTDEMLTETINLKR